MKVLDKEKRLKELLENNIRNEKIGTAIAITGPWGCLLYTSPSPRDLSTSRMPSSA